MAEPPQDFEATRSPAELIQAGSRHPLDEQEAGIALCLSGGGYRAMLFHLGSLWRLNELGYLQKLDRISSVSGGSITAAMLGLRWAELDFDSRGIATAFVKEVVTSIRKLAGKTIDAGAVLGGIFLPGSISDKVIASYRKLLYGDASLQDLPNHPRFVINATNVQSGALWRFSKPYMRDYRVGEVRSPNIHLAIAVAASSAFPPVLSPLRLEIDPQDYEPPTGEDLHHEPFLSEVVLTDGGVYDNLGLETAWKRYTTILVSDGGGKMQPEEEPKDDWARHALRINEIIDNQVRSLRKRQVIESFRAGDRNGAYWGIRTDIQNFGLADCLDCPSAKTLEIANTKTRLKRLSESAQNRLINWGYAVTDAALRRHVSSENDPAPSFPCPGGVG